MQLEWTRSASSDVRQIFDYISGESLIAADRVTGSIRLACEGLARFPRQGRIGKVAGTRELVIPSLPYIVIYRIRDTKIEILRVWHGAQER